MRFARAPKIPFAPAAIEGTGVELRDQRLHLGAWPNCIHNHNKLQATSRTIIVFEAANPDFDELAHEKRHRQVSPNMSTRRIGFSRPIVAWEP